VSPEIAPSKYSQLIFDKEAKAILWRMEQMGIHMQKNLIPERHLIPFIKNNPKLVTYVNIKCQTTKTLRR
jgi:hypothetical protein